MKPALDAAALDQIFREARTYNWWSDTPVGEDKVRALYDLMKFGPTTANSGPARICWVMTDEGRARLAPLLSDGNREKTMHAPVVAIIGYDLDFPDKVGKLFPHEPDAKNWWPDPVERETVALRNSALQGAYLIIAARALGLDAGPMSGFDNAGVDKEFFAGTNIKSNFICALGEGTTKNLYPRHPRLDFDEACKIV